MPDDPPTAQTTPDIDHQLEDLCVTLDRLARTMADLEERLVRPTELRVRDSSALLQKAAALRVKIEDLRTRHARLARQLDDLRSAMHPLPERPDSE